MDCDVICTSGKPIANSMDVHLDTGEKHDHSPVIAGTHQSADRPIQIMCPSLISDLGIAAHGDQPVRGEGAPTLLQE